MRSALLDVAIALLPATSSSLHDERQLNLTWVRIEGGSFVLGDNYADCPLANRTTAIYSRERDLTPLPVHLWLRSIPK